jgi:hypothetical protein
MQIHFVCSQCGFRSTLPGTCQNDTCIRQGQRLSECHCEDGNHAMVLRASNEEMPEDPAQQEEDAKENGYSVNTIDLDSTDE